MSSETHEIAHDKDTHPVGATGTYWTIGVILFVITALEIGAYYMEDTLGAAAVPIILALSAAKFILVVMFYMHLKYDSKVFSGIFLFPLTLGALVIVGMTLLYHVLHPLG
jgi:cytochrome c oxidase subunit 4